MNSIELPTTAGQIGSLFGADLVGDPGAEVSRLASLENAGKGALTFFANPKYADQLALARGSVVLTRSDLARRDLGITFLVVGDPQATFAKVAGHFRSPFPWKGISELAQIDPTAVLDPSVNVGPFACIGAGTRIGAGTCVYPFSYIGAGVEIGDSCETHPHSTLHDGVRLGNRVKIFSGAVVGSAGFGLFRETPEGPYTEMPQIGKVVIEDDVRMGCNSAVDRATLAQTLIGRGTKIDNLVHIGHNSLVGQDCVLCAQVGLGGSGVLENDVVLGGQVGLGHGVQVGSGARMGGQSGSTTNVAGKETYFFTPATPIREFARLWRSLKRLPDLVSRVKELEKSLGSKTDG